MSGLVDSALAILAASAARTNSASSNIGNMTTPGYKARVAFMSPTASDNIFSAPILAETIRFSQGPLQSTDNPLDLAIEGAGFFVVANEAGELFYTRQGHFQRDADGRMTTPAGHALQQSGGGDVLVASGRIDIAPNGVVLEEGRPIAQIALAQASENARLLPVSGSVFAADPGAMSDASAATIRQGMLEGSNVVLGDEMLNVMAATRQAETGARLVQLYDELMGRAFSTLGQRG